MKNKIITLLIVIFLFLSSLSIPFGTEKVRAMSKEGIVTVASLHLRESSSTNSKSLTLLPKGTKVQIISTKDSWMNVYVQSNKKTGWVFKKYISTTKNTTVTTAPKIMKYYVTASSLNVRQSATTTSKVVATVKKGASVTYYSKSGNWAKVKTASGVTGWSYTTYLSKTKPVITKTYYVTATSLHVRSSGSTNATVVATIIKGDSVTYYSQSNDWGKIQTKSGVSGYVYMKYLSTTKPKVEPNVGLVSNKGLKGKVIVLDPGHGGQDAGSIGSSNKEKDLTLETAKKVKTKLEAAGAKVVMTRTGDTYLTLPERVTISEKNNADVFISIHYNSGSSSASGIETYFWKTNKDESKIASLIQKEIIKSTRMYNRGTETGNYHVIRENTDSAVLVELGFISNPDEERIIETSDFQNKAAIGIVNGLEAYFN